MNLVVYRTLEGVRNEFFAYLTPIFLLSRSLEQRDLRAA
jgi:hypothetical protein